MKDTRAQAAMEFVMTYSWALLLVIIIFVMAWQLGLFNFGGTVRPGMTGFWGVSPQDYKLTDTGSFTISLVNEVGANVTLDTIVLTMGETVVTDSTPQVIESGGSEQVSFTGLVSGQVGERYDILMSIDYNDSRTNTTHKSSGKLWGSYER